MQDWITLEDFGKLVLGALLGLILRGFFEKLVRNKHFWKPTILLLCTVAWCSYIFVVLKVHLIEQSSFSPPYMFTVRTIDDRDHLDPRRARFEAMADMLSQKRSLPIVLSLPVDGEGNPRIVTFNPSNRLDSVDRSLATLQQIEYKRTLPLTEDTIPRRLWGLGSTALTSPTRTQLWAVKTSDIRLDSVIGMPKAVADTLLGGSEMLNIRLQGVVRLNGVAVGHGSFKDSIFLLGFDGGLYIGRKPLDSLGGPNLSPTSINVTRLFDVSAIISQGLETPECDAATKEAVKDIAHLSYGWQSIECLREFKDFRSQSAGSRSLAFLILNGYASTYLIVQMEWTAPTTLPRVTKFYAREIANNREHLSWCEGVASFSLGTKPSLIWIDAASGTVAGQILEGGESIFSHYMEEQQRRSYLEGVAIAADIESDTTLIVSDCDGRLYNHDHISSCRGKYQPFEHWSVMDLLVTHNAILHAQGLAFDQQRQGVWLGAENHFRFISRKVLSPKYRVYVGIRRVLLPTALSITGILIFMFLWYYLTKPELASKSVV